MYRASFGKGCFEIGCFEKGSMSKVPALFQNEKEPAILQQKTNSIGRICKGTLIS